MAQGLVERAIGRDAEAFSALVRPQLERLLRTATAILGDEADARDALQESLGNAWRDLPRLRDPERFEAWLARILLMSAGSPCAVGAGGASGRSRSIRR